MLQGRFALALGAALLIAPAVPAHADSAALTALKACRKSISREGRGYAKKRLMVLLQCVDKILKCEVQLELGDITSGAARDCRNRATDGCTRKIGPAADSTLSKAVTKFDDKAGLACLPVPFGDVLSNAAGGLWYSNDGTCGTAVDLPTLLECVREEVEEEADALVSGVKPRAGLILDNVGLGGNFPNLTRPPIVDVLVSATGAGTGILVDPGTINVPVGSALRFTGDSATLPCGGGPGMNGKLTITVGSQELELKEDYGPTRVAIFGPYATVGLVPYELDLKDGSCNEPPVTGDVNVM